MIHAHSVAHSPIRKGPMCATRLSSSNPAGPVQTSRLSGFTNSSPKPSRIPSSSAPLGASSETFPSATKTRRSPPSRGSCGRKYGTRTRVSRRSPRPGSCSRRSRNTGSIPATAMNRSFSGSRCFVRSATRSGSMSFPSDPTKRRITSSAKCCRRPAAGSRMTRSSNTSRSAGAHRSASPRRKYMTCPGQWEAIR